MSLSSSTFAQPQESKKSPSSPEESYEQFCTQRKQEALRSGQLWSDEDQARCETFWDKKYRLADSTGKLPRTAIQKFPELSTLYGVAHGGEARVALGVELFHNRAKPRKHRWKLELQLADNEIGLGAGYILVRGVNFTLGPFYRWKIDPDQLLTGERRKTWGLRAGLFKF